MEQATSNQEDDQSLDQSLGPLNEDNSIALNSILLPPPPEAEYLTEAEAIQAVKTFAHCHSYAVVTKRTNKGRDGKVDAIYLACDQGQEYRSTAQQRQRTPSRRQGCPFNVRISYYKGDRLWRVKVRDAAHNHGPSLASSHPSIRREELNQKVQYIKALLDINMPPNQILKQVHHVDPNSVIQLRDIYNLRYRLYHGKSPVPAILADFKPAIIKPRRPRESLANNLPPAGEVSVSGALGEGEQQGVGQIVASPSNDGQGNEAVPNPETPLNVTML